MHQRRSLTALLFALLALLVGFAAGCGGGEEGSRPQEQGGVGTPGEQGGGTGQKGKGRPEIKIAPGTIESVDPEAETLVLRPTQGEPMSFMILPRTKIEQDGKSAELADLREGQSVQVRYVVREGENRARLVLAFGGGETTG